MKPKVILNAGMTLDGKIASRNQDSKISCSEDIERVHKLRAEVDGIIVGINTVMVDDPNLTVITQCKCRDPIRIIVDSKGRLPLTSKVLRKGPDTIIAVSKKAPIKRIEKIRKYATVLILGDTEVNLESLMEELFKIGIKSLLLEGGGTLNWSMLKEGLVDEVMVAISPKIVGGREAITLVDGDGFGLISEGTKLKLREFYNLGEDLILKYEVIR
jgi:2,5-diamino-6-(ribosylamino)-4(3H)-pyrimidinone 5'-phosphate reductase|tara:strand:+ start:1619 stop:2263 length:645 start_codon:yes stop_codon:yes gene_type:complete